MSVAWNRLESRQGYGVQDSAVKDSNAMYNGDNAVVRHPWSASWIEVHGLQSLQYV